MCDLFEGRDFTGVMNVSYVAASTQPHARPFMQLAEMMGAVLAQLSGSDITSLQLKTWGGRDFNITTKQVRILRVQSFNIYEINVLLGLLHDSGTRFT